MGGLPLLLLMHLLTNQQLISAHKRRPSPPPPPGGGRRSLTGAVQGLWVLSRRRDRKGRAERLWYKVPDPAGDVSVR